jgi:hypothetical protein
MIVVKVELHSAVTGVVTELAKMVIANDGTSDSPSLGNYAVRIGRKRQTLRQLWLSPIRRGRIKSWPRRSKHVWYLVVRALEEAGYRVS